MTASSTYGVVRLTLAPSSVTATKTARGLRAAALRAAGICHSASDGHRARALPERRGLGLSLALGARCAKMITRAQLDRKAPHECDATK